MQLNEIYQTREVKVKQDRYEYVPKPDITAYELALLMPVFNGAGIEYLESLPNSCIRHFEYHGS